MEGWRVSDRSQKSEVRRQKSEVRGQRSEARGQKSEGWRVRRLATEARKLNNTVIPAGF